MKKPTVEYNFVSPEKIWKFNILADVDKTGYGDCGLFVEAKNEKEAEKYLKNLIKIIKENNFKQT